METQNDYNTSNTVAGQNEKGFQVQAILQRSIVDDNYTYEVKWVGYSQTTWEPLRNLLGSKAVERMVEQCDRKQDKKSSKTKKWNKGLEGWANYKKNAVENLNASRANNQNNNNQKSQFQVSANPDENSQAKRWDPLVSLKRKNTSPPVVQRYPNQKQEALSQGWRFKNIKEVLKVQMMDGEAKCLVRFKEGGQEWIPRYFVRLAAPEKLLPLYTKMYQQFQKNNTFP